MLLSGQVTSPLLIHKTETETAHKLKQTHTHSPRRIVNQVPQEMTSMTNQKKLQEYVNPPNRRWKARRPENTMLRESGVVAPCVMYRRHHQPRRLVSGRVS
jgi:hypothetical protein